MADVVVGDNNLNKPSRFSFIKKHKWLLISVLIFICIIGIIMYLALHKGSNMDSNNNTKSYSEQQMQLGKQVLQSNTSQDKLDNYYLQVALALENNKINDANKYANDMKAISDKNTSTYVALAFIANSNKDSQQAAYYWQKAIDSLNPNQDGYNLIKRDYQKHLDSVK